MEPKVSIILPVYNVEKYLDKCLETVTGQTLRDIEIICVNDASPDNSLEICKRWQEKDNRIVVVDKKQNEGLGLTRNAGIEVAKGKYIAFVDSDDYIDVQMYEKLYSFTKENKLDACWCDYRYDLGNRFLESREVKESFIRESAKECRNFMLDMLAPLPEYKSDVKHLVSVWRAVYSRKIIEEFHIRFESERDNGSEDIPFNMDFLLKTNRIGYIPFVGYSYRYNPFSLSRNYTHQKYYAYEHLFDEVRDRLEANIEISDCKLHYERFLFYFYRNIIKYEAIKNINGKKIRNIRMRCKDGRIEEVYKDYPYLRLPIKQRIFFFCMKHKIVWVLYAMCILENKIRKNV